MPDGLHSAAAPPLPLSQAELMAHLGRWIGEPVLLEEHALLPGGAIQHNWLLDLRIGGAPRTVVLRASPAIPLPESRSKTFEFDILTRARGGGVNVAEPLWHDSDGGSGYFISAFVAGNADREALWKSPDNGALLADLGLELAVIHAIEPSTGDHVETPRDRVGTLLNWTNGLGEVPSGVHAGLDWLIANAPAPSDSGLVHRDYRTGNFLVASRHLAAVLDWEFAGWGDPHEDIGWFCARCWRGPAPERAAGGLGSRGAFYAAYRAAGGGLIDDERVRFWEVFAHVRWALIAMQQGARARAGAWPADELEEASSRVPKLGRVIAELCADND